jgi:hypothetical protein
MGRRGYRLPGAAGLNAAGLNAVSLARIYVVPVVAAGTKQPKAICAQ